MSQEQLQAIIQQLKANPLLEQPELEAVRAGFEQMAAMFPVPADVKCEPAMAGNVKAEWVTAPGAAADRAILHLHGGGYVIGSINTHRALAAGLSRAAKARVLLIGYRLAPEHPHPAAVDDAVAAYRWLLAQGLSPKRIAIAGDSAGGGLTIATLVALRDAGEKLPAAGVCLSPWVDLEGIGDSMTTKADLDPMVKKDGLVQLATLYLGGKDPRTPLAAPLYADLSGLPPLLILAGTWETLLDDASRIAERARKAGVDVTYEPAEGMIHVWQLFAPILDEGKQSIERIGQYVRSKTE
ncbi:MAG TPA: alpha/beta hydrolase [Candidatus Binatia bacterium]|nr:alpha/beta hydrolase [Candidatus Binatia bacterium]